MSVSLDTSVLAQSLLGAVGVIGGVIAKNSSEKLQSENLGKLGTGLFAGGWLLTANAFSGKDWGAKTLLSYGSSLIILVVVMMMKDVMKKGEPMPMHYPLLFAGAWLSLGYSLGILRDGGFSENNRNIGIFSAVLVILSMMFILPYQRENDLVDGPGMPMFTGAWSALSVVNSIPGGL